MFKKILTCLGVILLIGFISVFVRGYNYQKEKTKIVNNSVADVSKEKKQEIIDEDIIDSILNQEEKKEDISKTDTSSNVETKEQKKENISTNEIKQNNSSNSNNTQPKTNNEKSVQNTSQQKTTNNANNQTQPKVTNAWDDLGISENEYYNSPMWGSWADVTYKIENFSSRSELEMTCQNEVERLFNEGTTATCIDMNSYSGKFLGQNLKIR